MNELPATFGKYYLTEKLATGGMAEIYLGKILGPAGFEKQLVIKQIHPKLSGQRHFVDLFVAEAKILVGLAHGNIVPVYELGVIDDTYFIAMEYIDGPTLYRLTEAVWRAGAPLAAPLAAWIAGEILDGLDYAHRKGEGVIHRDLSPRNVMLSRDGEVKLVDFGIAVGVDYGGEGESDGAPTGSFPYMSPEQVRRQRLTAQSDLFSVSVLLWEMLAGKRLFARATADETLAAVLEAEIAAPSAVRAARGAAAAGAAGAGVAPEVAEKLDAIVLRGLARDPAARWPTAAEYLAAINRTLYALEPVPGARDLAALIGRWCPPERARGATEGDAGGGLGAGTAVAADTAVRTDLAAPPAGDGHGDGPATTPRGAQSDGPATLVHPRDGVMTTPAEPRGKRAGTVREQSFATHVELERALARATPIFPIRAIRDELPMPREVPDAGAGDGAGDGGAAAAPDAGPRTTPTRGTSTEPARTAAGETRPPASSARGAAGPTAAEAPSPDATATIARGPAPGSPNWRAWGILLAIVAVVGGGLWLAQRGRSPAAAPPDAAIARSGASDATVIDATVIDAAAIAPPAVVDAAAIAPPTIDAAPLAPATIDAARGALPAAHDAAPRAAPADARDHASASGPADAAVAAAGGTAHLKVAANPWGEVYVDGARLGNAPHEWELPAGPHTIVVRFPASDPPQEKTFAIDLAAGETKQLDAGEFKP